VLLLLLLLCVSSVYSTALFDYFNGVDVVEGQVYVDYSPFTVTAWVNPRQYGYGMIVSIDTRNIEPQFRLELHYDGHVAFYFDGIDVRANVPGSADPSGWVSPLASESPIPLNTYTHVAVVRNGVAFFLYVNGKITSTTVGLYHANFTNPVPLRVGSRHTLVSDEPFNVFPGVIRNAAFYNKAFTAGEIYSSFLYNGQNVGALGGAKGTKFNDAPLVTSVRLFVDNGTYTPFYGIVALQVFWGSVPGPVRGGRALVDALEYVFTLLPNEVITGAIVQFDEFLQSIRFITSTGRRSQFYGKDRGTTGYITLPPGTGFSGFFGTDGWAIDSIGLNYVYIQEYDYFLPVSNNNSTDAGEIKVQPSVVV